MGNDSSKGSGSAPARPPPSTAGTTTKTVAVVATLNKKVAALEKRQAFIQSKANAEQDKARKFAAAKNKRAALMCLKRKKMLLAQLEPLDGAILTLQQQIITLEGASINRDVYEGMRTGADHMKAHTLTADAVDDVMDDIYEAQADQEEVSNALGGGVSLADDDDLLAELRGIEEAEAAEIFLPSAPSAAPTAAPTAAAGRELFVAATASSADDEAALKELEAMMA